VTALAEWLKSLGSRKNQAVCVDAESPSLHETLRKLKVGTVIHTAGPFQGQEYTVARSAIDAGCHYIDLADGRRFVADIGTLDAASRARAVTVVSGASSVPALSCAVVDRFLPDFERLESIRIGISSGAGAPGLATVRGVFSYAGKPIRTLRDGSWITAYGWRGLERHEFPSPLGRRWFGTCDVPDLDLTNWFAWRLATIRLLTFAMSA
jgi:saccharopine dehydrogenase-like NADP-dependent oxidoreductase